MQEALRMYLGLAMGITEASRKKVRKVVKDAVGKGGATAEQVKALTSDLLAVNSANRDALAKLVRYEVERALGAVGLATADEVRELTARIRQLEGQLRAVETKAETGAAVAAAAPGARTAAKKTAAKKTAARKAVASATLPESGPTPPPAPRGRKRIPAKAAPARATPTKTTPAKAATATPARMAKKATARKSAARKAQP